MAGIANNPNSPRQKMINLMYLVFIAMIGTGTCRRILNSFDSSYFYQIWTEIVTEELKAYYQTNPKNCVNGRKGEQR